MTLSSPPKAAAQSSRLLLPLAMMTLASPSLVVAFTPSSNPNSRCGHNNNWQQRHPMLEISTIATSTRRRSQLQFSREPAYRIAGATTIADDATPRSKSRAARFGVNALFARGPGRPSKASAPIEEEASADDMGYGDDEDDDDAEEEIEEETFDEDVEIGNGDDEEEDEDEIEFEYDEEEAEEEFDEGNPDTGEGEDARAAAAAEAPATDADIWASYDAAYEEPVASLLEDVESDPNYQLAKETVLSQVEERKGMRELEGRVPRSFGSAESVTKTMDYIMNEMTEGEREELEQDADLQEVERILSENNNMMLTEDDLEGILVKDGESVTIDPGAVADAGSFDDDRGPDAFPRSDVEEDGENMVYPSDGSFSEKDLVELDDKIAAYRAARESLANQTYFGEGHTMAYMDLERDWPRLSNETQDEILDVIENSNTMACPEPEMWLMYDLGFNVTDLILAAFKHNSEAPIMFTQWMPQLEVYERYADQRAKDFEWTWDDVAASDTSQLERYYKGIGYDEIPKKDPSETGVITLDTSPMDDEERELLALENWMDEVYNEESNNLLFDDESFEPRDSVFDPDFGTSSSDKSAGLEEKFMKEYESFEREFSEETQEWRDQFATVERFEHRDDPEGQEAFRGHLVVAITPSDGDLEIAEGINKRMEEEFGKAVFVETRVLGHARAEDNVFEVWLESFEIDLLHSKRQAFINSKLWTGPSDVDDKQLEYLVERVRYLISDDARYSYRFSDYADIKA